MLPNLDAHLKLWLSITLYYLQAEEIYVTVIWYQGTRETSFSFKHWVQLQVFKDHDPNNQNNFTYKSEN